MLKTCASILRGEREKYENGNKILISLYLYGCPLNFIKKDKFN